MFDLKLTPYICNNKILTISYYDTVDNDAQQRTVTVHFNASLPQSKDC